MSVTLPISTKSTTKAKRVVVCIFLLSAIQHFYYFFLFTFLYIETYMHTKWYA